jgi:hypothetical protein
MSDDLEQFHARNMAHDPQYAVAHSLRTVRHLRPALMAA